MARQGDPVREYLQQYDVKAILENLLNECVSAKSVDPFGTMSANLAQHAKAPAIAAVKPRERMDARGQIVVELVLDLRYRGVIKEYASATISATSEATPTLQELVQRAEAEGGRRSTTKGGKKDKKPGKHLEKVTDASKKSSVETETAVEPAGVGPRDAVVKEVERLRVFVDHPLLKVDWIGVVNALPEALSTPVKNAFLTCLMVAAACIRDVPLYQHIQETARVVSRGSLPIPVVNVIRGGPDSAGKLKFGVFGFTFHSAEPSSDWRHTLERLSRRLRETLIARFGVVGQLTSPDGLFCAPFDNVDGVLEKMEETILSLNLTREDVGICIDIESANSYNPDLQKYDVGHGSHGHKSSADMKEMIASLADEHRFVRLILDPLAPTDNEWAALEEALTVSGCRVAGRVGSQARHRIAEHPKQDFYGQIMEGNCTVVQLLPGYEDPCGVDEAIACNAEYVLFAGLLASSRQFNRHIEIAAHQTQTHLQL